MAAVRAVQPVVVWGQLYYPSPRNGLKAFNGGSGELIRYIDFTQGVEGEHVNHLMGEFLRLNGGRRLRKEASYRLALQQFLAAIAFAIADKVALGEDVVIGFAAHKAAAKCAPGDPPVKPGWLVQEQIINFLVYQGYVVKHVSRRPGQSSYLEPTGVAQSLDVTLTRAVLCEQATVFVVPPRSKGSRKGQPSTGPVLLDAEATARVKAVGRDLSIINKSLLGFNYSVCGGDDVWRRVPSEDSQYHVVFNDGGVKAGGRNYCRIQNLPNRRGPAPMRETLLFDGRATIEADFSNLHIRMAYDSKSIPLSGDAYELKSNTFRAFPPNGREIAELRGLVKQILLALPNTGRPGAPAGDNLKSAKATARLIYERWLVEDESKFAFRRTILPARLTPGDLVDEIIDAHAPIRQLLYSGMGKYWQSLDGEIARRVMLYFAERGRPCLGVHDSFMVWEEDEDELLEVMKAKYTEVMVESYPIQQQGLEPNISIKAKRRTSLPIYQQDHTSPGRTDRP